MIFYVYRKVSMESQVERTVVVDNEGEPVMMMQRITVAAAESEEQAASGPTERRTLQQLNVLFLPEQLRQALRPTQVSVVREPDHDDDDDCDCTCGCLCVLKYIIIILVIILLLPFLPLICLCACCYQCCCKD